MLIKICGFQNADLAAKTALAGSDYIGLVFHFASRRHIADLGLAKDISAATRENGAIPVAVFAHQTAQQMLEICTVANIQTIQLHGDIPRQEHHLLSSICISEKLQGSGKPPNHTSYASSEQGHLNLKEDGYTRFYVQPVLPNGIIENIAQEGLSCCDPEQDYILFDNVQAGKGKPFDWNQFQYSGPFRVGLAGGLNAKNVSAAIQTHPLHLVDTSSGVENAAGEKDIFLIQDFIQTVRALHSK